MNSDDTITATLVKCFSLQTNSGPQSRSRTHCRQEGLHVLIGICYCGQVNKVSVQDLLIPEKTKQKDTKKVAQHKSVSSGLDPVRHL